MKNVTKKFVRCFVCSFGLLLLPSPCLMAEVRVIKDYKEETGLTVYQMTVSAAAEPKPALKHRLQLRTHEYKPGNAATYYLRANAENGLRGAWKRVRKEFGEAVDEGWYSSETPLSKLPLDKVRKAASSFDEIVSNYIAPASYRQNCDWGYNLTELRGTEVFTLMLPGVQQSRSISRMLALRTRLAIAEGRYDEALDHIRMNYRLAHNVGQEPIIVCGLVGLAEAGVTNGTVLDLIAAPGSPNLYWALSELPRPMVDLHKAVQLEMSMGLRVSPFLIDAETADHSSQEWARLIAQIPFDQSSLWSMGDEDFRHDPAHQRVSKLMSMGITAIAYPPAKRRLLESGMDKKRVDQMSIGQALAIDAAREYQRIADEYEKWWYAPFPLAVRGMREARSQLEQGNFQRMQGG